MKKEHKSQPGQGKRILGRLLAKELGDEEMKIVVSACGGPTYGPTTLLVTGLGCEDN
jgi:hypothetical protein